jgi:two-component system, cell cycle sensor histidine kinase and response regulator CckA
VNLVVNARDAMPNGGTVTIAVRDLLSGEPDRTGRPSSAQPFVRISVSDTGIGMDEETRRRIFDPFFTTKGPGKGTGIGLATVRRIAEESGGRVGVETVLGEGSTFHVDLPLVGSARLPTAVKDPAGVRGQRSGVVLVVDDDPVVAAIVRRALEAGGYTVLSAAGAAEAIAATERLAGELDVLVTDISMPGVQGPDLAAMIRATRPDMGVVFMSGDTGDLIMPGRGASAWWEYLPKPFSVEAAERGGGPCPRCRRPQARSSIPGRVAGREAQIVGWTPNARPVSLTDPRTRRHEAQGSRSERGVRFSTSNSCGCPGTSSVAAPPRS